MVKFGEVRQGYMRLRLGEVRQGKVWLGLAR
jgi:hypothetical protein